MAAKTAGTTVTRTDEEPDPKALVLSDNVAAIGELLEGDSTPDFGREDVSIPFLRILQSNSPEVKRGDAKQIEGAREGDLINTATQTIYSGEKGAIVVPVYFTHSYTEWIPRNSGGGLVRDYGADPSIMQFTKKHPESGRDVLENGNEVVHSGQYYCLIVDPETGDWEPVVVAMSSTQFKKSRRWNTLIDSLIVEHPVSKKRFKPAMFYMTYRLTTVPETNKRGAWMGWLVEKFKPVIEIPRGGEIYLNARELRESILRGDVKAQAPDAGLSTSHEEGDQQGGGMEGDGFPPQGGDDEPY